MSIEIDFSYQIDGFYHSVNYYRSETPMDPDSMPVATTTGITGTTYTDTTAENNKKYYIRFGAVRNDIEKISSEIIVLTTKYKEVILADNPIAYYPLNELSGSVAADIMSSPVNGNIYNCTLGQTALSDALGTCYYFNGTNSRIELGSPSKFALSGSVSMEVWIKGSYGNPFQIGYNSGLRMQLGGIANMIFGSALKLSSTALTNNTLYHIVFTCTSSQLCIYINGVLSASVSGGGWSGISSVSNSAIGFAGAGYGEYFNGYISNAALYNYELTAAQVLAHYNAGVA